MTGGYGKMEHKFVFIHVPRTAGTTFKKMMRSLGYKLKADNSELDNCARYFIRKASFMPFRYKMSLDEMKKARFINGHTPLAKYYPLLKDTHKFITWVRDPVERTVSQWNWWRARGFRRADIGGKIRWSVCNNTMSVVQLAKAMPDVYRLLIGENLEIYDWIGIQEDFKGSLKRFEDTFGIKIPEYENWNVKGKNYTVKGAAVISEKDKKNMCKYLEADYKIYDRAREMYG